MKKKRKINPTKQKIFIDSQGKEYTAARIAQLCDIKHGSAWYKIKRLNEIKTAQGIRAAEVYLRASKVYQTSKKSFIDSQGKEYTAIMLAEMCNIQYASAYYKIKRLNKIKATQGVLTAEKHLAKRSEPFTSELLTPEQIITLSEFRVQCEAEDEQIKKLREPW